MANEQVWQQIAARLYTILNDISGPRIESGPEIIVHRMDVRHYELEPCGICHVLEQFEALPRLIIDDDG